MSQQFLRQSKDRRLGLDPNSFSVGQRTNVQYSSRLGLEPNSFCVFRRTDVWDSSRLGLDSIVSESVDVQTYGTRVNSFAQILRGCVNSRVPKTVRHRSFLHIIFPKLFIDSSPSQIDSLPSVD